MKRVSLGIDVGNGNTKFGTQIFESKVEGTMLLGDFGKREVGTHEVTYKGRTYIVGKGKSFATKDRHTCRSYQLCLLTAIALSTEENDIEASVCFGVPTLMYITNKDRVKEIVDFYNAPDMKNHIITVDGCNKKITINAAYIFAENALPLMQDDDENQILVDIGEGTVNISQWVDQAPVKIDTKENESSFLGLYNRIALILKSMSNADISTRFVQDHLCETESNVAILNGVGYVPVDGLAVLSTVSIDGKEKGVDYSATYDDNGQNIIIKDLNNSLSGTVVVKYNEVENLANLNIASVTFDSIDYFEQLIGEVPSVFLAPQLEEDYLDGSSAAGTVASKLKQIVEGRINSHWYTQAIIQMTGERDNLSEEKALKGYDSHKTKVCWPYVKKNSGLVYSLSVLFSVAKLSVDIENDGIPFESASNEIITDVSYLCDKDGNRINQTEKEANALNEIGIATANFVSGSWRTWGICMANYVEVVKDAILPEKLNDVAVQMRDYISNDFQKKYIDHIDKPIPSRVANEIVGDYQLDLNTLVSNGALLFGSIEYDSSASDELNGDFVFNIAETHTPPGKSITAKIGYTKEGLSSYEGSDE